MCGIAGGISATLGSILPHVTALNDAQQHRGPDHCVIETTGRFALGNTRLAIQDPTPAGNQPFVSSDGRYHCVFNGEIYNYRHLVEKFNLPVRTACDGEVIPQLWAKLGHAALAELRGMYAIALVDELREILFLARDPFGIKPIYWCRQNFGLLFASEARPLARQSSHTRINQDAIAHYLHLGAVPSGMAPFIGINAIPPNTVVAFDLQGRAETQAILPAGPVLATDGGKPLSEALQESIELHLGADVPTALLLSAGIDSAAIAAVSRRLGRDLDCLTIATLGATDESKGALQTARHYRHKFTRVAATLDGGDVDRFFQAMQRPTIDGLNTYLVTNAVHQAGFKVALSGLGGDEAVGGYSHFRALKYLPLLRTFDRMPRHLARRAVAALTLMGFGSEAKLKELFALNGPRDGRGLSHLQRKVLPNALATDLTGSSCHTLLQLSPVDPVYERDQLSEMIAAEVAIYLQGMLLPDADGFSMASSVELRVPFVDSDVFSATLRMAAGKGEHLGKRAVADALEDSYLRQLASHPKKGFDLPMHDWLAGPLAPVLEAAREPEAPVWSVIDRNRAERAGLTNLEVRERWVQAWLVAALNGWLVSLGTNDPAARTAGTA